MPGPAGKHKPGASGGTPGAVGKNDAAAKVVPPPPQKSLVCACNRDLTIDELAGIFTHSVEADRKTLLPVINDAFKAHGLTTCLRKAHILTQIGPETNDMQWLKERGAKHGGYEGRGLLQLTFLDAYTKYGKSVDHDFLGEHAKEVEEPKWAADSAGWFWEKYKELNSWADKNDLMWICCKINGGFIGYDERRARLPIALDWLLVHTCKVANIGDQVYVPYDKSGIYDNRVYSFAWGLWNDPTSKVQGIAKRDPADRKAGYQRYLDLQDLSDKKVLALKKQEAAAKAAKAARAAAKAHHAKPGAAAASAPPAPAAPIPPPPEPEITDVPIAYGFTRKTAIAKAKEGIK